VNCQVVRVVPCADTVPSTKNKVILVTDGMWTSGLKLGGWNFPCVLIHERGSKTGSTKIVLT
jgi:hypothetical protein